VLTTLHIAHHHTFTVGIIIRHMKEALCSGIAVCLVLAKIRSWQAVDIYGSGRNCAALAETELKKPGKRQE
jgi:hypothetical protein